MARSNQGGTRGWLRGRVANDLYQVTRKENGQKEQLVRAVEESRTNPNTISQAMARMQMAMCMTALKQFKEIVDHSWEGVTFGRQSMNYFARKNVKLIQQDCEDNWSSDNNWSYPIKGSIDLLPGLWQLSEGTLKLPDIITRHEFDAYGEQCGYSINLPSANCTMGQLKAALGLNANDYITYLAFADGVLPKNNKLCFFRVYINEAFPDDLVISLANYQSAFTYDQNTPFYPQWDSENNRIIFYFDEHAIPEIAGFSCDAIIISRWDGVKWCRNTSFFQGILGVDDYSANWTVAWDVFQSWFPEYDPEASDEYPLGPKDFVDLGLPSGTLWAKCNVGATSPEQAGLYFSWGNVDGYRPVNGSFSGVYTFDQATYNQTPGASLTGDIDLPHDAARFNMGKPWRMPSTIEFQELIDNCTFTTVTVHGVTCWKITSNVNGKSITCPFNGYAQNNAIVNTNLGTFLWTLNYNTETTAYRFFIRNNGVVSFVSTYRFLGLNIRAVQTP